MSYKLFPTPIKTGKYTIIAIKEETIVPTAKDSQIGSLSIPIKNGTKPNIVEISISSHTL